MRYKNKKGILAGETVVKIVIAVLVILILIILGVKVFNMFNAQNQERRLTDILDLVSEKMDYLKSSAYTENYLIVKVMPPEGKWYMQSYLFKKGNVPEEECVGRYKSCLCMCDELDGKNSCDDLRVCKGSEYEIFVEGKALVEKKDTSATDYVISSTTYSENTLEISGDVEELEIEEDKSDENKITIKEKNGK